MGTSLLQIASIANFNCKERAMENSSVTEEDLINVYRMVDKLLIDYDVICACAVGRTFLLVKEYDRSLKVFTYIRSKLNPLQPDFYIVVGNVAYSLVGLKRYADAISEFLKLRLMNDGKTFFAWHSVGLAHAYFCHAKESATPEKDMEQFRRWLDFSNSRLEFHENLEWFCSLYPEIAEDLRTAAKTAQVPSS